MSHSLVLVTGDDIEAALAPYDENIDVERYVRQTKEDLIEGAKRYHEQFKSDPETFRERYNPAFVEKIEREVEERKDWTDEDWYKSAIEGYESDQFSPDGGLYSTYNPKSKWDWYVVGGRWSNRLTLKDGSSADTALVSEVDLDKTGLSAFAYLHDGEWHERGSMGWFGMVADEKDADEWKTQFDQFVQSLPPTTRITMVDIHI